MTNHRPPPISGSATVRLLELDPDLLRLLSEPERDEAGRIPLRVIEVSEQAFEPESLLGSINASGAIVIDGMLRQHLRIGSQLALRILGPGELVAVADAPSPMLLSASDWHAAPGTQLALLGEELLFASRRWPGLHAALQARMAAQLERLATQLVICQLPRVEDRLLAMLWLLAETWGRVTLAGTTLPLSLTHEALGALVGARRSTVTLALGELAERGALVHQDRGWLLLEPPSSLGGEVPEIEPPRVLADGPSEWSLVSDPEPDLKQAHEELLETVRAMRSRHEVALSEVRDRMRRTSRTRRAALLVRERIREQRAVRERSTGSGRDEPRSGRNRLHDHDRARNGTVVGGP